MARFASLMIAAVVATALPGCAPGDVELNGKIFDAMGVSTSSLSDRGKTPRVAERAPLVMPPSMERLPPPEERAAADPAFPIDPEKRSTMSADAMQQRQAAYCKENYDKWIALGDPARAATAKGPLGPCTPSALSAVGVQNSFNRQ